MRTNFGHRIYNTVIVGGGLAGCFTAYWRKRLSPDCEVLLVDREEALLSGFHRHRGNRILVGNRYANRTMSEGAFVRGASAVAQSLASWDGQNLKNWLSENDFPEISEDETGCLFIPAKAYPSFRDHFRSLLERVGVELKCGMTLTDFRLQPQGGFRLWFQEDDSVSAEALILATGGERNHVFRLLKEAAIEVNPITPGYIRLKTASRKWGSLGNFTVEKAGITDLKSGHREEGRLKVGPRGIEGEALSALGARCAAYWSGRKYKISLGIDWLPEISGGQLRQRFSELVTTDRRSLGEHYPLDVPPKLWSLWLQESRVVPDLPWARLKKRSLQTLITQIKQGKMTFSGMGLPEEDRAWNGGLSMTSWDWETAAIRGLPGAYAVGEILDILGQPGGFQPQMAWSTGYLAGAGKL